MKIFSAQQIREWDAYTISHQPITSLDLMEHAAQQCTNWLLNQNYNLEKIQVICGKRNNGGDGLAIARQLDNKGIKPQVFIVDFDEKQSSDFTENLVRLQQTHIDIQFIKSENDFSLFSKDALFIECLFGNGLNRPLSGSFASLITYLNSLNTKIISIDIPAGMFTDSSSKNNIIIEASETLTFQTMKLCFLMAENADYFGDVHILPLFLSDEYEKVTPSKFMFTDMAIASSFYKKRKPFSHKGTYGHALLVAGNEGKMGAAVMSATSCLRSGVGLLTCSIPENDFAILHNTIPEAMVIGRSQEEDVSKYTVVGTGPGLGTEEETAKLVHSLIQQFKNPMVIDADALNIISKNKDWLKEIPKDSVLTPHPKEFERLFGESRDDFERINKAIRAAFDNNIILVLKGTYTLVTDGKQNYFNSTGNNGMATGGSGDILTGMITGLLAQKYPPFEAAVMAVFIHGLSADLCLEEQSYESLLPMDMIQKFGKAFQQLQKNKGA